MFLNIYLPSLYNINLIHTFQYLNKLFLSCFNSQSSKSCFLMPTAVLSVGKLNAQNTGKFNCQHFIFI